MEIVVSYDIPSTFTLSPPSYRAASPLSLTCEVQGLDDYTGLLYDWSGSVCTGNCFSKLGTSKTVSTDYLHSYDTGVHTCMVYDTLGCAGNTSISIEVVGKYYTLYCRLMKLALCLSICMSIICLDVWSLLFDCSSCMHVQLSHLFPSSITKCEALKPCYLEMWFQ